MQASSPGRIKLTLRSSHRRVRLGVSHRDVPSTAWTPRSKDSTPARPARRGKR